MFIEKDLVKQINQSVLEINDLSMQYFIDGGTIF